MLYKILELEIPKAFYIIWGHREVFSSCSRGGVEEVQGKPVYSGVITQECLGWEQSAAAAGLLPVEDHHLRLLKTERLWSNVLPSQLKQALYVLLTL